MSGCRPIVVSFPVVPPVYARLDGSGVPVHKLDRVIPEGTGTDPSNIREELLGQIRYALTIFVFVVPILQTYIQPDTFECRLEPEVEFLF